MSTIDDYAQAVTDWLLNDGNMDGGQSFFDALEANPIPADVDFDADEVSRIICAEIFRCARCGYWFYHVEASMTVEGIDVDCEYEDED